MAPPEKKPKPTKTSKPPTTHQQQQQQPVTTKPAFILISLIVLLLAIVSVPCLHSVTIGGTNVLRRYKRSPVPAVIKSGVGRRAAVGVGSCSGGKALVISKAGDETLITKTLTSYNTPYDIVYVDSTGFTTPLPTLSSGTSCVYQMVITTSTFPYATIQPDGTTIWGSSLNDTSMQPIYTYLSTYNLRLIKINDVPDPSLGVGSATSGSGFDNGQNIVFDGVNGGDFANMANLQQSLALSSAGLYHYPATITNSTLATSILLFYTTTAIPNQTVAAALITNINNGNQFQQLSFYMPFPDWSVTSQMLSRVWFAWGMGITLAPSGNAVTVVQKGLVLTRPNEANATTLSLLGYGIPFDVIEVP
ncbi:hypothetical protein HDU76_009743, partial [Blyttiomyces sp. JEL0837]